MSAERPRTGFLPLWPAAAPELVLTGVLMGLGALPAAAQRAKHSPGKPAAAAAQEAKQAPSGQAIVVLVNDEPISAYDVEQRMNFMMLSAREVNDKLRARLKAPDINT